MPLPHISLTKKLIILLAVPALVQLGIVGGLSWLEYRMQVEADRAERARQIKDGINSLINERYKVITSCENRTLIALGLGSPIFSQEQSSLYQQITSLKEMVRQSPKDYAAVQSSERSALQAMAILQQLKDMYDQGNIQDRAETKPLVAHLKKVTLEIVSPDLIDLGNHEGSLLESVPKEQRLLRDQARWLAGGGGALSLLLTLLAALFLVRRVALPLEHMLDETTILRKNNSLHGQEIAEDLDEIGRLEAAVHEMIKTIGDITAKQLAAVDNAGDMICTIDENGKITHANAAAGKLFGCHQADLIDKNYRDLVQRKDAALLSDYLQRARAGAPGKPVNLQCVGKGRRNLYVSWSAQWSASEEKYFAVVHDLTQIKEAQRMKQEIVGILTRDLRAPINSLQEFLDLLEEGSIAKIDDRGQRFVDSAKRNADQMLMLINDLIDLEKAKSGLLGVTTDELNLDKVIDKAQVKVAPLAEEKEIVLDCRRSGLTIKGEEAKLLRAFTNLLVSAVQRAPRESSILLVSKSQDGFVQVSISDRGTAMSKEQLGTIFDAYAAAGESEHNADPRAAGSGLSLAISKAFIELHGGTITASSREGEGTTFVFTLPLASTSAVQKARTT